MPRSARSVRSVRRLPQRAMRFLQIEAGLQTQAEAPARATSPGTAASAVTPDSPTTISLTRRGGAPLRLRAERQLGDKMTKRVMRIELVDSMARIGDGGYSRNGVACVSLTRAWCTPYGEGNVRCRFDSSHPERHARHEIRASGVHSSARRAFDAAAGLGRKAAFACPQYRRATGMDVELRVKRGGVIADRAG